MGTTFTSTCILCLHFPHKLSYTCLLINRSIQKYTRTQTYQHKPTYLYILIHIYLQTYTDTHTFNIVVFKEEKSDPQFRMLLCETFWTSMKQYKFSMQWEFGFFLQYSYAKAPPLLASKQMFYMILILLNNIMQTLDTGDRMHAPGLCYTISLNVL